MVYYPTFSLKNLPCVRCELQIFGKNRRCTDSNVHVVDALDLFAARQQDIRNLADLVDACMKQEVLCVFGGQEKIDANKQVFGEIHSAL